MKKYFFIATILIFLLILLGYIVNISLKNDKERLFSCAKGSVVGIFSCAFFDTRCSIFKGGTVWADGHPGLYTYYSCYKKSSDFEKQCASNEECTYGCDLSVAIKSDLCTLISNELLEPIRPSNFKKIELFKKQYNCSTLKPGKCRALPENGVNPGGIGHEFRMEKEILIETRHDAGIRF